MTKLPAILVGLVGLVAGFGLIVIGALLDTRPAAATGPRFSVQVVYVHVQDTAGVPVRVPCVIAQGATGAPAISCVIP